MDMSVYLLDIPNDDDRWACFLPVDESSVLGLKPSEFQKGIELDFFQIAPKKRTWKPHRLKEAWKPRSVNGKVKPYNDYPALLAGVRTVPTFSQKAVHALFDLLEPNGELLPLIAPPPLGIYYSYNTTTLADVLDVEHCTGVHYYSPQEDAFQISGLDRYEFFAERVGGLSIFRLPEFPSEVFVTEIFAQRVRDHKLWGMLLNKVWPLPPGVNWRKAALQNAYDHLSPAGKRRWDARDNRSAKKPQTVDKITSGPLDEDHLAAVAEAREEIAYELRLAIEPRTPEQIQEWVHQEIARLQASEDPNEVKKERAFVLAIAWGDSLVETLGWEWVMLMAESGKKTLAVADPIRSHAVPVMGFFSKLISSKEADNTSLLLFNMIRSKSFGEAKPGQLKLLS